MVGDRFVQVVDGGPAAGPFVGSIRTSTDGLTWEDVGTATGPLFAVAGGPVVNVFGQGGQVASADGITWQEVERPEIGVTFGATVLPDGRSVVLGNSFGETPSVMVHIVPPVVVAAPQSSPASSAAPSSAAPGSAAP